jgi:DNA (cytosine-5)-methyltransferase 1
LHEAPIAAYAIQAGALRTNPDSGPDGVGIQAEHAYTLEARAEVQCVAQVVGALACNTGPKGHDAGNFACNQAVDAGHVLPVTTHTLRGEGFDASEDGTGRGTPLVPVGIFQDSEFGVAQYDSAGTLRAGRIPEHQMVMQPVTQPYTLAIRGRGDTHQLEYRQDGTANALLTPNGGRGGIGVGAIAAPVAIRPDATPKWQDDLAFTLTQPSPTGGGQPQAIAFHPTQDPISSTDVCHSIGANENATAAVAVGTDCFNGDITGDVAATMGTRGSSQNASGPTVMQSMQVRRLTPVECERLQGFPDNYTAIPWRKKPASECPDGPRYKALGNSWAVPVVRWIGRRIAVSINSGCLSS